jgi:hypothetical protein
MSTLIEEDFSNFTALKDEPEASFTEPNLIDCVFLTGCAVDADEYARGFTGWTCMPSLGSECDAPERRIIVRFAMPIGGARLSGLSSTRSSPPDINPALTTAASAA